MNIHTFISTLPIRTLVEIGANDGTDTLRFREMHPQARIVCFEPDPRNIELLKNAKIDRIYILNDSKIVSLHPVLIPVFKEVCSAFEYRNIPVRIVQSIKDVDNYNSSLVFVGNNFHVEDPASELAKICPNATYCLWYWHDKDITPLKRGIHIYENMLSPTTDDRVTRLRKTPYNCPLLLRACEPPDEIGKYPKAVVRDYFYSGAPYCSDWMQVVNKHFSGHGIYNGTWDVNKYMAYDARKECHKYSFFALGFQGSENIANKHVSQRVYEGMAYGCVVLTNSDAAVEQTEGICVKVENALDLVNKMNWFKQHPTEMERRRQLGYEFVKRCGTNHYAIDQILKVIKTLPEINL